VAAERPENPEVCNRKGIRVSSHVFSADSALAEGLSMLRAQMRDMLSTTIRGEGGVPRTRSRPHTNEAPSRHGSAGNVKPVNGRLPRPSAGVLEDETVPLPTGTAPPILVDDGEPEQRTPPPSRPDPGDAASEVWALIERAQAGDGAAFGLLYDRYFDTVFRFVYFRVGNRQLAEDLTADTFLRALKRIGSFTWQGRDLGAWLVTIARNLVADHFKSGRYRLEVTTGDVLDADRPDRGPEGSPEAAVIDHITNVDLLKAVKQLNPEQQECIVLRFLHGFSVAETAQAMSKNEGAIKALQYRAVRALARLLPDGFQP
jgi:RNA polymerase sigma-70 factor (ECF subfamily)